jgi:hypothetical protein
MKTKIGYGFAIATALVAGITTSAFAAADASVVSLATDAGTSIKDTAIGVLTVLIPLAVGVFLARKALPWAKRMVS